jgi:2-dehydro-3-deoxyphosphogluconate aldolase / (4S)-4-hydroxy-2-oxoglutarate aldolase
VSSVTATTASSPSLAVLERFSALRILPVIVIDDPADAVPLAGALSAGGLPCAEVTLRTPRALEALARIAGERPDVLVGAGTVLSPAQAAEARTAGARFVVAPGFNPAVVEYCQSVDLPVFPGVCTPTEIEMALGRGLSVLKFFPAEPMGGLSFLKAIAAPYVGVSFMPTGGIGPANLASYLAFSRVASCGGSWMAPNEWIAGGQFDRIRDTTAAAVAIVAAHAAGAPS